MSQPPHVNFVIGYPLCHSQSPLLHQFVYQRLNLNAKLIAKPHSSLAHLLEIVKATGTPLTAVTSPFKEEIIPYLDEASPEVISLKAANTLIQKNGKLIGFNTDLHGIAVALEKIPFKAKRVLVLGAGGAARAIGFFLRENKAQVFWFNRNPHKAEILALEFGGEVLSSVSMLDTLDVDLIVNTTSLGTFPQIDCSPLPNYAFKKKHIVFDMVYNPAMTRILLQASRTKSHIISGLDMFIAQGLKQIELWQEKPIPKGFTVQLKKMLMKEQPAVLL